MTESKDEASRAFYAPAATHNPLRFFLPMEQELMVGPADRQFLMGGVGLAAAIDAMERATDRPLIWATAQYLSFVQPGAVLDLDVRAPVVGRNASQARAVVHRGEQEVLTVNAALGSKADQPAAQFVEMPKVPLPDECPRESLPDGYVGGGLYVHFDQRVIQSPDAARAGKHRKWIRTTSDLVVDAGLLAIVADFLLSAVGGAMALDVNTSSLDNTLRIHDSPMAAAQPGSWLLCDTQMSGVAAGFCHGDMRIFSEGGVLLATGSQSGIVRVSR